MQKSMRKQMQYAIKSFATRAIDEWILDYPQQVVVSVICLVLTNEINDILDEKTKIKEQAEASDQENEEDKEEKSGDEDGATPEKAPE